MEEAFYRFMKAIDLQQFEEMMNSSWGQEISYFNILYLFIIGHSEKTTVSELSNRMNISKSAVTQKINELEDLGLIKKVQSVKDRRMFEISLSDKILNESHKTKTHSVLERVRESYREEELDVFTRILITMSEYIEGED